MHNRHNRRDVIMLEQAQAVPVANRLARSSVQYGASRYPTPKPTQQGEDETSNKHGCWLLANLGIFSNIFPTPRTSWLPTHFRAACVLFPDISGHLGTALGRLLSATRYASVVVVESSASAAWTPYFGCILVLEALPGRPAGWADVSLGMSRFIPGSGQIKRFSSV